MKAITGGAEIVGPYRYRLWRAWGEGQRVLWIMLNPSIADASQDDPTIRRCIGFSRAYGFAGMEVANLFARRATNPKDLRKLQDVGADIIGRLNNATILSLARTSPTIIAAWGQHGKLFDRDHAVLWLLNRSCYSISCLGHTKDRSPKHPLYLRHDTKIFRFDPA